MKLLTGAAVLLSLCASATAGSSVNIGKLRVADAAADACFANCAAQNNSCKRTCPASFNMPCLSSCDAQAQSCQQGCRR